MHPYRSRSRRGAYLRLVLAASFSLVIAFSTRAAMRYVNVSNTAPAHPYTNWATAATMIQDAVDAAAGGDTVLVTNGTYNPIRVGMHLTVESVRGFQHTSINGGGSQQCVRLSEGAFLRGFTVSNGYVNAQSHRGGGAGVWCDSRKAGAESCRLVRNVAYPAGGGGSYGGTLRNCDLSENEALSFGGGAYGGLLEGCTFSHNISEIGAGAYRATLVNCIVASNQSSMACGGADSCMLENCLVVGNTAESGAGGAFYSVLRNCTVVANRSSPLPAVQHCELYNCIVFANTDLTGVSSNFNESSTFWQSCSFPAPDGEGNIGTDPAFTDPAAGDYRLTSASECIDTGGLPAHAAVADGRAAALQPTLSPTEDLSGNRRVFNGAVDMGAYEFTVNTHAETFLRGAYEATSGRMGTTLAATGRLPTNAPYSADMTAVSTIPTNATDWLLLQLRRTNDMSAVANVSCFVKSDGTIVNSDGGKDVRLECSPGHYYLLAVHRNHLTAMSAQPVAYTNDGTVAYDFTTGPDRYYGGTNACVQLSSNLWGMIAGDADGDGRITRADRTVVSNQVGMTGYLPGDLNLDGKVNGSD